jgi:non-lysosomal glucosylceramidase
MKYDRRKFIASVGLGLGAMKVAGVEAFQGKGLDTPAQPQHSKVPEPAKNHARKTKAGPAHPSAIPACAWRHPLGDTPNLQWVPPNHYGSALDTKTRTKKGMPLGGIGAGNFMYNVAGSFGPWIMKPSYYEERFLSQAAFHVREGVQGKQAKVRTLATDDVLPAWSRLNQGDGDYHALFPRGWVKYKVFDTDISLEFFSPIIKDNYRETSLPVASFTMKVRNPLQVPAKVSVMFTFPNAPYTGPQNHLRDGRRLIGQGGPATLEEKRTGLVNEVARVGNGGAEITAIVMRADHPSNTPGTQNSAWCIATQGKATYVTAWDGAGDGSDIWSVFAAQGALTNSTLSSNSQLPSGALAVEVEVPPQGEVSVPFVLSWFFPEVQFGEGTRWLRRYTEYFPKKDGQALAIAREALLERENWFQAVEAWTGEIVDSPACPDWLKQVGLNELYYSVFGSFWENGCITKPKKFGNRPGQHLEFVMESLEYRDAEALDVRHHYCRTNRDLWPQIERDILLVFADCIMDTPDGSAPHNLGSPEQDPFFKYDSYASSRNNFHGIPGRTTMPWGEFAPKFMQQSYAYWHKTGDNKFLDEVWPSLVRSYRYQKTTDTDNDGITEMKSDEYLGNKLFNATLWIGALEMLQIMAEVRRNNSFAAEVEAELEKARASSEREFWNTGLGYYQYNEHNTDIMADAMLGERYVDVTGLRPVLTPERMTSHYRQLFRRSVLPLMDLDGDGIGDLGVANVLHSDSTPGVGDSESPGHPFEVWTGVSYAAAANLYHWGKKNGDGAMQLDALHIGWGVYQQSWMNEKDGYWFNTPEAWTLKDPAMWRALMYPRVRAIWELLMEVHDPFK